jgi:hypothetical protein
MKHLSFRVIFLCIVIPPVIYLLTVQSIEAFLSDQYRTEIEDIYTGDTGRLFQGRIRLKDAVNENIDRYLQGKTVLKLGVKIDVSVTTGARTVIYPLAFEGDMGIHEPPRMQEIASENFRLMNEGLVLSVAVRIERNTPVSNAIFGLYYMVAVFIMYGYYRAGVRRIRRDDLTKSMEIERLLEMEKKYAGNLATLVDERRRLSSDYLRVKGELDKDKAQANRIEEEMVNEIIALEEKIEANLALMEQQQKENEALRDMLQGYEKDLKRVDRKRSRDAEAVTRRFKTLYKKLSLTERAVDGFLDLTEDARIKAEEIIHQLNEDPSLVPVKRKVFTGKGRQTVLEVMFAYNGRLYYRYTPESRIEIVIIGNKNSQTRDLQYIDSL